MGHDAVMTPGDYCYFDHYQADPATQPKAIGGLTTLRDVYHYDPVSKELNDAEKERILGAQGNVWTEYISTPEHVEYMAVPRMIALAEVDWSQDNRMNWERFTRKLEQHFVRLDIIGVNYCDAVYMVEITPEYNAENEMFMIGMKTEMPNAEIRYTLDGTAPGLESTLYDTLFELRESAVIKAQTFVDKQARGQVSEREINFHKAIGKTVTYTDPYSDRYTAGGDMGLVNGIKGSVHYGDGRWQGFSGDDAEAVIDLGEVMPINRISVSFLQNMTTWIFLPASVEIFTRKTEEAAFEKAATFLNAVPMEEKEAMVKEFSRMFTGLEARYIKLHAANPGPCPAWHPGAGSPSWVFTDEIIVE